MVRLGPAPHQPHSSAPAAPPKAVPADAPPKKSFGMFGVVLLAVATAWLVSSFIKF
jgi:hypothetical protein